MYPAAINACGRAAVGFDADQHLVGLVVLTEVVSDQRVQFGQPVDPLHQPAPDHLTLGVLDLDVVMALRPVVPNEQHQHLPLARRHLANREENEGALMGRFYVLSTG